jgi:hypothetical protein
MAELAGEGALLGWGADVMSGSQGPIAAPPSQVGGFRHSDTIVVTDEGCVSLTQAPERLEDVVLCV